MDAYDGLYARCERLLTASVDEGDFAAKRLLAPPSDDTLPGWTELVLVALTFTLIGTVVGAAVNR